MLAVPSRATKLASLLDSAVSTPISDAKRSRSTSASARATSARNSALRASSRSLSKTMVSRAGPNPRRSCI